MTRPPAAAQIDTPREGLAFLDTGPLRIREQLLLPQPFVTFCPSSAEVLGPGHVDFGNTRDCGVHLGLTYTR